MAQPSGGNEPWVVRRSENLRPHHRSSGQRQGGAPCAGPCDDLHPLGNHLQLDCQGLWPHPRLQVLIHSSPQPTLMEPS